MLLLGALLSLAVRTSHAAQPVVPAPVLARDEHGNMEERVHRTVVGGSHGWLPTHTEHSFPRYHDASTDGTMCSILPMPCWGSSLIQPLEGAPLRQSRSPSSLQW